jgi:hypothetical protein
MTQVRRNIACHSDYFTLLPGCPPPQHIASPLSHTNVFFIIMLSDKSDIRITAALEVMQPTCGLSTNNRQQFLQKMYFNF